MEQEQGRGNGQRLGRRWGETRGRTRILRRRQRRREENEEEHKSGSHPGIILTLATHGCCPEDLNNIVPRRMAVTG